MISLLYHDVVADSDFSASGFGGSGADRYKLTVPEFENHVAAIAEVNHEGALTAIDPQALPGADGRIYLTFDDGGVSAHQLTAEILERRGWRGTFFITTDYIGKPAFLNAGQIRDLRQRGHSIGTHSCSHPPLMARRPRTQLNREWRDSAAVLSDILGEPIVLASVPGGFYAPNVAAAAAESGITALFNSDPVSASSRVDGCQVYGRYAIQRNVGPRTAARIVAGDLFPRFIQYCHWHGTMTLQRIGGMYYHRLRRAWLEGPSAE
ncbi:MAG TPA: polysaccharide deacetylase family protein [Bryobacteraceae bacterium]|jgi:peptidoglycan/xylan/chitin deacetylase (PgdA/CDA1 family)|nr:polysaccharide deacetylase family protein [Bryobacteraceae bacterium]